MACLLLLLLLLLLLWASTTEGAAVRKQATCFPLDVTAQRVLLMTIASAIHANV